MANVNRVYSSLRLRRQYVLKSIFLCFLGLAMSGVFWPYRAAAEITLSKDFANEIESAGLVFNLDVLRKFKVTRVLPNKHFKYRLALKHQRIPFEVRYAIRHLNPVKGIRTEFLLEPYVSASIMNMARMEDSDPVMTGPTAFAVDDVRAEFGADWGITSMIGTRATFSKYSTGMVSVIYLQEKGVLAYSIYLFNGKASDETMQIIREIFYAMQFRRSAHDAVNVQ
ncbi:hypothetical protein ACFL48_03045 [Pseudomonadota bacterium]